MRIALFIAAFWAAVVGGAWSLAHAECLPPTHPMSMASDGVTIRAQGQIVTGTAGQFAAMVATSHPRSLIVDSGGGNTWEAVAMADTIRVAGIAVVVPSRAMCASACFTLFAAGQPRTVSADSSIGVHRAMTCSPAADSQAGTDLAANKAAALGATPQILARMTTTPGNGIAWLTRDELAGMGVRFTP